MDIKQGQELLESLEPPGKVIQVSEADLEALLDYQREFHPLYYGGRNYTVAWRRMSSKRYVVWLRPETYQETLGG